MSNVNSAVVITAKTEETKVAVINNLISCISEDRQIDLNDIEIKVEELPAATRKMLCEKIFPRDFLRPYHRIREQAEDILEGDGAIRTPMGGINSRSSAIEKIKELQILKTKWNLQKEEDKPRYDQLCKEHLLGIGQAALDAGADPVLVQKLTEHLMKKQPSWEQVNAALKFEYVVTIISLDESDFDPELMEAQRDSVVALRDGVMGALVQHVCGEALQILKLLGAKDRSKPNGQIKINPRTVRRAQGMITKLESLAFVHPLIRPLHDAIKAQMVLLPDSGVMTSGEFANFVECLNALRDQTLVWERLQKGLPLIQVTQVQQAAASAQPGLTAQTQQSQVTTQQQPVAAAPAVAAAAPAASAAEQVVASPAAPAVEQAVTTEAPAPVAAVVEVEQEETVPAVATSMPVADEQPGTPDLFTWI